MPIVNQYQPNQAVLGNVIQQGAYMQALGRKREREEVRLQQERVAADNRAWQERLIDKRAAIEDEQMRLRNSLAAAREGIQAKQEHAFRLAQQGLLNQRAAQQAATKLQMQKEQLEAEAEQRAAELEDKKRFHEFLDNQKIENFKKMSATKQDLYAKAIDKRDKALQKIEESPIRDAKKRELKARIEADFERQWGHVKKPPEAQEIVSDFQETVTPPNKSGDQYFKDNSGKWNLLPTSESENRKLKLEAEQKQREHDLKLKSERAKLVAAYLKIDRKDENGNPRPITVEEANVFADGVLGTSQTQTYQPLDSSNEDWDYDALGKMLQGTAGERRWAKKKLFELAKQGDKRAEELARQFAQQEQGGNQWAMR